MNDHLVIGKAETLVALGHDGWIEWLERELADALIARAEGDKRQRMLRPDYASMTPSDLQARARSAFGGE